MGKPRVRVCVGSSCRKEGKAFRKLLAAVEDVAKVERVKCQKVCDGPVAGVTVDGTIRWFAELDAPKRREALLRLLASGEVPKRLQKREARKRAGRLRR